MGKYNLTYIDHDSEESGVGVHWVNLTAGNMTAQLALLATLKAAIEAVVLGTLRREQVIAVTDEIAGVAPASGWAQRETKWLVQGVDAAGFKRQLEIPTADLTLLSAGTGVLDITTGVGQDLADALNAGWMSNSGSAVTVERIIHVGRNL